MPSLVSWPKRTQWTIGARSPYRSHVSCMWSSPRPASRTTMLHSRFFALLQILTPASGGCCPHRASQRSSRRWQQNSTRKQGLRCSVTSPLRSNHLLVAGGRLSTPRVACTTFTKFRAAHSTSGRPRAARSRHSPAGGASLATSAVTSTTGTSGPSRRSTSRRAS